MRRKQTCGAYARSTGNPCQAKALPNGRCKNHGGMSTGPKTLEGRRAISEAMNQRMASGQRKRVIQQPNQFDIWNPPTHAPQLNYGSSPTAKGPLPQQPTRFGATAISVRLMTSQANPWR